MAEVTQQQVAKDIDPFLKKFERFEKDAKQLTWVSSLRKAGIARFAELGLPTLQHEDWRFTNTAPIAKLPFKPVFDPTDGAALDALNRFAFAKLSGPKAAGAGWSTGLNGSFTMGAMLVKRQSSC